MKRYFTCDHFSYSYGSLKIVILAKLENKRAIYFALLTRNRDLIRLRSRSKLVEGSLFALIDLLQGAKSIFLYFRWRVGGDFRKNIYFVSKTYIFQIKEKTYIFFYIKLFRVFTAP